MSNVISFNSILEPKKNLVVFTDPGIDDSICLLELTERLPNNINLYVCPVSGNADNATTLNNARRVLNNRVSAILISEPIDQTKGELDESYGGTDGLGDCGYFKDKKSNIKEVEIDRYKDVIDVTLPTDFMILSPCGVPFNFMAQFVLDSDILCIGDIYIMGGCEEKSNMNGLEFNQALDENNFNSLLVFSTILQQCKTSSVYIATLDSCESPELDLYNISIDKYNLPTGTKELFKAGKRLVDKRKESSYFIYDLTVGWFYLEKVLGLPSQFEFRENQLKGTKFVAKNIIVPHKDFKIPWKEL